MTEAFQFVLDTLTSTWTWLGSWQFHGVAFSHYLLGFAVLSILITRIFN